MTPARDAEAATAQWQRIELPSDWDLGGPGSGSYTASAVGADGQPIVIVYGEFGKRPDPSPVADRIADALNGHDELVAALRLMLAHGEASNWFANRGDEEVCDQARAALAKVSP